MHYFGHSLGKDQESGIDFLHVGDHQRNQCADDSDRSQQSHTGPSPPPQGIEDEWGEDEELRVCGQVPGLEHAQLIRSHVVVYVQQIRPPGAYTSVLLQTDSVVPHGTTAQPRKNRAVEGNNGQIRGCQSNITEDVQETKINSALPLLQL